MLELAHMDAPSCVGLRIESVAAVELAHRRA